MKAHLQKNVSRRRRSMSVRASIRKTATRPRLSVHRSLKHISAQIIDDKTGRTLVSLSSTAKALSGDLAGKTKTDRARLIGTEIGKRAKEAGIDKVVFDRGSCRYHGRVKALAEGARESGLEF